MKISVRPFPALRSDRLVLRQIEDGDAGRVFALRSDARWANYLDIPVYETLAEAENYIRKINTGISAGEWILWVITLPDEDRFAGSVCFWNISDDGMTAEIGYDLLPEYQSWGIMAEAVFAVVEYGFRVLRFKTITAFPRRANAKSIAVLENNNFILTVDVAADSPAYCCYELPVVAGNGSK